MERGRTSLNELVDEGEMEMFITDIYETYVKDSVNSLDAHQLVQNARKVLSCSPFEKKNVETVLTKNLSKGTVRSITDTKPKTLQKRVQRANKKVYKPKLIMIESKEKEVSTSMAFQPKQQISSSESSPKR